ncbi:hypothetical protein TNCV_2802891, partial [Trichonephila clavipes]
DVWAKMTRYETSRENETQTGEIKEESCRYRLVSFLVGVSRCLAAVQLDASQRGKSPFAIVLTSTMGD